MRSRKGKFEIAVTYLTRQKYHVFIRTAKNALLLDPAIL